MAEPALNLENALAASEEFLLRAAPYANEFAGRGVILCGGGLRYFPSVWVCVQMLRRFGCSLPVQLWHLGTREVDQPMCELLRPLGVECVDALPIRDRYPARILNGWELKPFAILHCPFKEVLLLDADNVPVVNPEYLFETPNFRETGGIFWPDFGRLEPERPIWSICGIPYRDEPEFESGQIVIDKERCWKALQLCMWYNEHSDFYYQYVHGDKETFHLAFRKLGKTYSMPSTPIYPLDDTMCQHDFEGRRIFQHRNLDKWQFLGENKCIADFWYEAECRDYLRQLRETWDGRVGLEPFDSVAKPRDEQEAACALTKRLFVYRRVGYDERLLGFLPRGRIGTGAKSCEVFWALRRENGDIVLEIAGENGLTCRLKADADRVWRGNWLVFEKMPVELIPTEEGTAATGSPS
jgi:hypothetical protein